MEKKIIIQRFFASLEMLKNDGVIRGLATFTTRYGLNRWNVMSLRSDPDGHDGIFSPVWLMYLARDYMVSPLFLLLGEGSFYRDGWTAEKVRNVQNRCKSKTRVSKPTANQ